MPMGPTMSGALPAAIWVASTSYAWSLSTISSTTTTSLCEAL